MAFRDLLVKEFFADDKYKKVLEEYAPALVKSPAVKLMGKKTCGEVFDLVVSKKILPEATAKQIEAKVNALIDEKLK